MTFFEAAIAILQQASRPLSPNEIWEEIERTGLASEVGSEGATPKRTLGTILRTRHRKANSPFEVIGSRPMRFKLIDPKGSAQGDPAPALHAAQLDRESNGLTVKSTQRNKPDYLEKHLHPFLAHFAYHRLNCYTKTINHAKTRQKAFGEWVHPDMVGCVFPIGQWDEEVLTLSSVVGNTSIKFISFELKQELTLGSLRENFFQTVSNSSWANESYLVAAKVSRDQEFMSELSRLSGSFGIGVIELNLTEPKGSKILFQAETRDTLDWETINKLTRINKDFVDLVKRVRIDLNSSEIRDEWYDKVLAEQQLGKLLGD